DQRRDQQGAGLHQTDSRHGQRPDHCRHELLQFEHCAEDQHSLPHWGLFFTPVLNPGMIANHSRRRNDPMVTVAPTAAPIANTAVLAVALAAAASHGVNLLSGCCSLGSLLAARLAPASTLSRF